MMQWFIGTVILAGLIGMVWSLGEAVWVIILCVRDVLRARRQERLERESHGRGPK